MGRRNELMPIGTYKGREISFDKETKKFVSTYGKVAESWAEMTKKIDEEIAQVSETKYGKIETIEAEQILKDSYYLKDANINDLQVIRIIPIDLKHIDTYFQGHYYELKYVVDGGNPQDIKTVKIYPNNQGYSSPSEIVLNTPENLEAIKEIAKLKIERQKLKEEWESKDGDLRRKQETLRKNIRYLQISDIKKEEQL